MKYFFKQNVGAIDRTVRLLIGIICILSGVFFTTDTIAAILIITGILMLFVGITGYCPTYTLLGISTKRCKEISNFPTQS